MMKAANRHVFNRFLLKAAALAAAAILRSREGPWRVAALLFLFAAILDTLIALLRRDRLIGPILTYWDEAALFLLLSGLAAVVAIGSVEMTLPSLWETLSHIVSLALAYALALPVGWDREKDERSAGIRTFPLVAIASCGFVLVGIAILGRTSPAQARLLEGLITGVGFIGGGAILKHGAKASGTATAASLWATGALGAPVGYGLYDIAAVLSLATFLTLRCSRPLKRASGEQVEQP